MLPPKRDLIVPPIVAAAGIYGLCNMERAAGALNWFSLNVFYLPDFVSWVMLLLTMLTASVGISVVVTVLINWTDGQYNAPRYRLPKPIYERIETICRLEQPKDGAELARIVENTTNYFLGEYPKTDVERFTELLDDLTLALTERREVRAGDTKHPDSAATLKILNGVVSDYETILAAAVRARNAPRAVRIQDVADRMKSTASAYNDYS